MIDRWPRPVVAVALLALVVASAPARAADGSRAGDGKLPPRLDAALPDGNLRRVLERMGAADRQAVLDRSAVALRRLQLEGGQATEFPTQLDEAARDVLTVEAARQLAEEQPTFLARLRERLKLQGSVALPRIVDVQGQKAFAKPAGVEQLLDRARKALETSPYIYRPRPPKDEGPVDPFNRQTDKVARSAFRNVVGLAKRNGSGVVELYCSGLLITPGTVVTAAHCVVGPEAPAKDTDIIVLTQFTNGTQTVVRSGEPSPFTKVSFHSVKASRIHGQLDRNGDVWKNDLAVIQLSQPMDASNFAAKASGLPKPVVMTAAGWGETDAMPVNGVALEVTTIRLMNGVAVTPVPPSLLSWEASRTDGAGICRGDSGGPIFAGAPDGITSSNFKLVGLVAAGDTDCRSGSQLITDLTNAANRAFVCENAAGAAFCA